ncbi:hypothetical protein KFU94_03095 [Chloroflexi bacterium TSY]|nr:hypothetical protein [Chloroflexi bacterium TSY]
MRIILGLYLLFSGVIAVCLLACCRIAAKTDWLYLAKRFGTHHSPGAKDQFFGKQLATQRYQRQREVGRPTVRKLLVERSNQEWCDLLKHETCDVALAELGLLLRQGLQHALTHDPLVDEAAVESFVEQALRKIQRELDTFAGQSRFTTWAQKIAVHIALREIRRQRNINTVHSSQTFSKR